MTQKGGRVLKGDSRNDTERWRAVFARADEINKQTQSVVTYRREQEFNTKKRKQYLNTVTSNQKQVISNHNQQPIYESYEELSREQYLKDAFFLGLRKQP